MADASFVPRLLLREPAMGMGMGMGFGRPHLVTASLRIGARLPPGVIAVLSVTDNSPFCSAVFPFPTCVASSSTSSARARPVVVAAWDVGTAPTTFFNTPAPVAGAENALLRPTPGPSSRRRRGVVARAGARPSRDTYVISASKHIRAWVDLATFKTKLEVAVDEAILSARDLRLSLDEIGDITLPAPTQDLHACRRRISSIIGEEKLDQLFNATPHPGDHVFMWTAAEAMIKALQTLMDALYVEFLTMSKKGPASTLASSCSSFMKQVMKVVCEFSNILETTKFGRPNECLAFRMLERHALAMEHAYAVTLDIRQECEAGDMWIGGLQELRSRRVTLSELDIGLADYMMGVGLADLTRVLTVLKETEVEVKMAL